jgi:sugar phosphate isomerase/epimerase
VDADYVRLFSYWMPDDESPAGYRTKVVRRVQRKTDLATDAGVVLLYENEKGVYEETPVRVRDSATAVDSPYLKTIFDPANYLEVGVRPYPDALLQTVETIEFLHIKDAVHGERGAIRAADEGDGRITGRFSALAARGFTGFVAGPPSRRDRRKGQIQRARCLRVRHGIAT